MHFTGRSYGEKYYFSLLRTFAIKLASATNALNEVVTSVTSAAKAVDGT
jgi:hypothetical protein